MKIVFPLSFCPSRYFLLRFRTILLNIPFPEWPQTDFNSLFLSNLGAPDGWKLKFSFIFRPPPPLHLVRTIRKLFLHCISFLLNLFRIRKKNEQRIFLLAVLINQSFLSSLWRWREWNLIAINFHFHEQDFSPEWFFKMRFSKVGERVY